MSGLKSRNDRGELVNWKIELKKKNHTENIQKEKTLKKERKRVRRTGQEKAIIQRTFTPEGQVRDNETRQYSERCCPVSFMYLKCIKDSQKINRR